MENKAETTDFFLTRFTNYVSLEDAYIYIKLGQHLGLGIYLKTYEPICSDYSGIFRGNEGKDFKIKITLSGSAESIDKFNELWNKIDRESIKMELNNCLSIGFYETIED